jgi:catechol 2,3-dioxygenase-like lactoylglutathione lyase family enzyme
VPRRLAAYTSYTAQRFETTRHFYESILGCTPVNQWDREDGRGVYYDLEQMPLVEILAPPGAEEFPPEAPPPGGVSIVIVVEDLRTHRADLVGRGGEAGPVVAEDWGTYFGLADPDGVPVSFVERASP